MKITSLAITEDDPSVRRYLAEQIRLGLEVTDLYEFVDAESALAALERKPVDIALFDVQLPGMTGIECIRLLKAKHPRMQMMVLTVYDQADVIFEALKAGATSYLLKSTPPQKIMESIQELHAGGSPISSQIARKVIEAFALKANANEHFEALTRREQEILELLNRGFRYKEIAAHLFLSLETVRSHVRNVYEKLQVNCRTEALRKTGLI